MNKQQGWPQACEYSQSKLIQTLGRASQGVNWSWSQCIKSHHTQMSSGKELPNQFWNRNKVRSILPALNKLNYCSMVQIPRISFGNQGLESERRLERHIIQAAWSPVWSFHSQWWFGVLFFFGTQRRRSHFSLPVLSLIFPACSLVLSHLLRDSLCTALQTERLWIWSTGLSTQLTPSSRQEAWVLGNLSALTERSQLATRWTCGRGGG